jgi:hypothetical protein
MEFQLGARTLFATKDQASYRNMVQVGGQPLGQVQGRC